MKNNTRTINAREPFVLSAGGQDDYEIHYAYVALEDIDGAIFDDLAQWRCAWPHKDRAKIVDSYLRETKKAKPIIIKELWLDDSYYYESTRYSIGALGDSE